jgi:hypothetical protein
MLGLKTNRSGCASFLPMVQSADLRNGHHWLSASTAPSKARDGTHWSIQGEQLIS